MNNTEELEKLAKTNKRFSLVAGPIVLSCLTLAMTGIGISLFNNSEIQEILNEVRADQTYIEYRKNDEEVHAIELRQDGDSEKYDAFVKTVDTDAYVKDYILKNDAAYTFAFEKVKTQKDTGDVLAITGLATSVLSIGLTITVFENLDAKERRLTQENQENSEEKEGE